MFSHRLLNRYAAYAAIVSATAACLTLFGFGSQGASTHNNTTNIYPAPGIQPAASSPEPDRAVRTSDAAAPVASDLAEASPPVAVEAEPASPEPVHEPPSQSARPIRYAERSRAPAVSARRTPRIQREEPMQQPARDPEPLIFRHVAQ